MVELSYGTWLAWLDHTDRPALDAGPAARCSPERVEAFVTFLREGGDAVASISLRLSRLALALDALIKWIGVLLVPWKGKA